MHLIIRYRDIGAHKGGIDNWKSLHDIHQFVECTKIEPEIIELEKYSDPYDIIYKKDPKTFNNISKINKLKETILHYFQLQSTKTPQLQRQLKAKIYGLSKEEQKQLIHDEEALITQYRTKKLRKEARKKKSKSKKNKGNKSESKSETETETKTEELTDQEKKAQEKRQLLLSLDLPPILLYDPLFDYQKQLKRYKLQQNYVRWLCKNVHSKYRNNLWGFIIPSVSYRMWLNTSYLELIKCNNNLFKYIRIPLFRGGATFDDFIIHFCGFKKEQLGSTLYGINNLDAISSWGISQHFIYQYSPHSLFIHPYEKQKKSGDDPLDLTAGQSIYLKPAWPTNANFIARLNTYFNPRYLLAWFLIWALKGIGSNGPETIHK